MTKWERVQGVLSGGNAILRGDEFHISFNANPGAVVGFFAGDAGSSETALCRNGKYLILNGDFRVEYEPLVEKGYDACLEFFNSKKGEFASSWSDADEEAA